MRYDRNNPSPRYRELLSYYSEMHQFGDRANAIPAEEMFDGRSLKLHIDPIKGLIEQYKVSSLLDYGSGKALAYENVELRLPDGRNFRGVREYWADISQLTFKSMAIVSTLHRHGNSIPFPALR